MHGWTLRKQAHIEFLNYKINFRIIIIYLWDDLSVPDAWVPPFAPPFILGYYSTKIGVDLVLSFEARFPVEVRP